MSGKGPTTTATTEQDSEGTSNTSSATSSDTTGSSTTSQSGTSTTNQSGQSSTKSSATGQTASTTNPWEATMPGLKNLISQLDGVATTDAFTPNYSDATMQGISQLQSAGQGPSAGLLAQQYGLSVLPQTLTGVNALTDTASGAYMNGNPYLQQALNSQYGDIQNRIAEQFSSAGRLGSGMQQKVTTEALAKAANDAMLGNYNTERGYQMQSAGQLSGLGQAFAGLSGNLDQNSLFGAKTNLAAGQILDEQDAAKRQAELNAYDYRRKAMTDYAKLGQSSTGTSSQTAQSDTASSGTSTTDSSSTSQTDSTSSTDSTTDALTEWVSSLTGEQVNSTKTDKTSQIVGGLLAVASLL